MKSAWRLSLVIVVACLVPKADSQEPKKEIKADPKPLQKMELRKEPKKESRVARETAVDVRRVAPGPIGIAYGYWPGPVLPGMWGGTYGGLWPDSWWLGGPYLYSGWTGSWGQGWGYGTGSGADHCHDAFCGGGAWPSLLPPVFRPVTYPAVSPYWVPRVAPFWLVPAAARPVVIAKDDSTRPAREYRLVSASANADKLYADALWLFSDENFKSARDHLAAAVKQSPHDARLWYYKALSERAMGDEKAARQSAENGAALEIVGITDKKLILTALERIQGTDRSFLSDLVSGPKALSIRSANEIVAELQPAEATTVTSTK
jgi:hypothetical protein